MLSLDSDRSVLHSLQAVQKLYQVEPSGQALAGPADQHLNRVLFIGRFLDKAAFEQALQTCVITE